MKNIISKLKATLKNSVGSAYIEFLVGFLGILMCLSFAFSVLPVFSTRSQMDNIAEKMLRIAEVRGDTEQTALIAELQAETGISFTVDWSGTEYMPMTNKIQLKDDIQLKISTVENLSFFEFGSFPVTLNTSLYGTSEVYHK